MFYDDEELSRRVKVARLLRKNINVPLNDVEAEYVSNAISGGNEAPSDWEGVRLFVPVENDLPYKIGNELEKKGYAVNLDCIFENSEYEEVDYFIVAFE